ncbi:MAG: hypothetical protein HGA99_09685 [Chlorobiaceae bacterium]|nr:hypothetical protein [Chlorobiaceae bacterium]
MKQTLAQTHPKLQSAAGMKEMLFREVVSSSKIEGIRNAKAALNKWYKEEVSGKQSISKKIPHQHKV